MWQIQKKFMQIKTKENMNKNCHTTVLVEDLETIFK